MSSYAGLDPVWVEAVKTLAVLMNKSTGLSHPSDKATFVDAVKRLRADAIPLAPGALRFCLAAHGFEDRVLDELVDCASDIYDGREKRTRRGAQSYLKQDALDTWKAAAGQGTD